MKFNWGTGIVIGMLAFICFIMYFVVTMMSSANYDHDLVVEDYYKAELHYQQDIDAEENALSLEDHIKLERKGEELYILFPETLDLNRIKGVIKMYRPSNKKLDFDIPFSTIESMKYRIPSGQMVKGRWNVNISWEQDGKEYLSKKEIVY